MLLVLRVPVVALVLVFSLSSCKRGGETGRDAGTSLRDCDYRSCLYGYPAPCRHDTDCGSYCDGDIWFRGTCIHGACQFAWPASCATAEDCDPFFTGVEGSQECTYVEAAGRRLCRLAPGTPGSWACDPNTPEWGGGAPCGPCGVEGRVKEVCQCVLESGYALCVPGTDAVVTCLDPCLEYEWYTPPDGGPTDAGPGKNPCLDAGPGRCRDSFMLERGEECPKGYYTCRGGFGWFCFTTTECDACCTERRGEECDRDAGPWEGVS